MKKSFKWIMEFLSFRLLLFFLVFAIQLLLLLQLSIFVNKRFPIPVRCLNAVLVIWIINKKMPMAHKLAWVALMLLFSQVGGFFYLFLCLAANRKRANTNGSYALGNEIEKYSNAPKLPL
ncbi:MAG: PLD nuclease N-terminal domain-containing protein, partial [Oscillospiraceae bacterium]|nr:PLD nuclease N-terminal domain-containing protein [Oscillospiraceae bacterium]